MRIATSTGRGWQTPEVEQLASDTILGFASCRVDQARIGRRYPIALI